MIWTMMKTKGGEDVKKKIKTEKFTESLAFSVVEGSIDEAKRTVKVCALASCISKNNRYYSPQVVESVSGTLIGKKSFADHDIRDTKNLIGKIVGESDSDGKLYADIRISKARGIANQTWEKLSDGTIDAVSIAGDGDSRRVKMGEKYVNEVRNLKINSVDFVTEGGIEAAKVVQVIEDINNIPEITEVDEEMIENVEQLIEKYPDFVKEIEEKMKDELDKLRKEKEELAMKLIEKELADHKETSISKLEVSDAVKDILRGRVSGKTKEELTTNLKKESEYISLVTGATKPVEKVAKIEGVSEDKKPEVKHDGLSSKSIREDDRIPEDLKGATIQVLWNEGEEAVKKYLKGYKIEL